MALTSTDLFIVGRGATNYNITADNLANYILSGSNKIGLGLNVTGNIVKVSIPVASTPPAAGPGVAQAIDGSLYWDDTLTQLFIRYNNAGSPVWVAAAPSAGGGSTVTVATLAEAAAGNLNTKFNSPETSVPKDSAGMAGAAIIPSGTLATATAAGAGKLRYYTDTRAWLGNDGTNWVPFDQRYARVTAVDYTAKAQDYVVVTAATKTITLPAAPPNGTCVTVVVAGTFLDTVVAPGVGTDNIMGLTQSITLDKQYAAMQFTYVSSTSDWRLN